MWKWSPHQGLQPCLVSQNNFLTVPNLLKAAQEATGATHIIGPATPYGKNILPRLAAMLDVNNINDVTDIKSEDTFERPIYAGNAIATVQSLDAIKVWKFNNSWQAITLITWKNIL